MATTAVALCVSLLLVVQCHAREYVAAVMQHSPYSLPPDPVVSNITAVQAMLANLETYENYIIKACEKVPSDARAAEIVSSRGTTTQLCPDIIVFPEDGLTGDDKCKRQQIRPYLEQIPDQPVVPCQNPTYSDRPVLQRASCLAAKYQLYLVLDMGDLVPCAPGTTRNRVPCPADGAWQFNTQVAFDRQGTVVAKCEESDRSCV